MGLIFDKNLPVHPISESSGGPLSVTEEEQDGQKSSFLLFDFPFLVSISLSQFLPWGCDDLASEDCRLLTADSRLQSIPILVLNLFFLDKI